jgi:hypothetical protein
MPFFFFFLLVETLPDASEELELLDAAAEVSEPG